MIMIKKILGKDMADIPAVCFLERSVSQTNCDGETKFAFPIKYISTILITTQM